MQSDLINSTMAEYHFINTPDLTLNQRNVNTCERRRSSAHTYTPTGGGSRQVITSPGDVPVAFTSGEGRACLTPVSEGFDNTPSVNECCGGPTALDWDRSQMTDKGHSRGADPLGSTVGFAAARGAPGACGPIMTHTVWF